MSLSDLEYSKSSTGWVGGNMLSHLAEIGKRCKEIRLTLNIEIGLLAEAINVDVITLVMLEDGAPAAAEAMPLATIIRLADRLGVDAGDLLAAPRDG